MSDGEQSTDKTERPASVKIIPEGAGERKVWVEMYPGGDAMIEVGHIDNCDELYVSSGEAEALQEALTQLVECSTDPATERGGADE